MDPDRDQFEAIFEELGLAQYLPTFIDQGFDTWETILDIQESDLDELRVKLGHRRKLQRRIAQSRGQEVCTRLDITRVKSNEGGGKTEHSPEQGQTSHHGGPFAVQKRKYRRHPKADRNAPEKAPSAYFLFSNKVRDDLKGRNLSFTEIAKMVGVRWQSLSPAERLPFETKASQAKGKYQWELAEYRKTPEYRKYRQYLLEFKEKQAMNRGSTQRHKVDDGGGGARTARTEGGHCSSAVGVDAVSVSTSPTVPSRRPALRTAPSLTEADVPPARRRRVGSSTSSQAEVQFARVPSPPPLSRPFRDDAFISPGPAHFGEAPVMAGFVGNGGRLRSMSLIGDGFSSRQLVPISNMVLDGRMSGTPPPPQQLRHESLLGGSSVSTAGPSSVSPESSSTPISSTSTASSAGGGSGNGNGTGGGSVPICSLLAAPSPSLPPPQRVPKPPSPHSVGHRPLPLSLPVGTHTPLMDHGSAALGSGRAHGPLPSVLGPWWQDTPQTTPVTLYSGYSDYGTSSAFEANRASVSPVHSVANQAQPERYAPPPMGGGMGMGGALFMPPELPLGHMQVLESVPTHIPGPIPGPAPGPAPRRPSGSEGLDALLKAGEIVARTDP